MCLTYGNAAGPIRNKQMIDQANCLVAFPLSDSKGTKQAIAYAKEKKIPVFVYETK